MDLLVVATAFGVLPLTAVGWFWPGRRAARFCSLLAAAALAAAVLVVLVVAPTPGVGGAGRGLMAVVAIASGGPVIAALLAALEQPGEEPAAVLRGGAWIGVLE